LPNIHTIFAKSYSNLLLSIYQKIRVPSGLAFFIDPSLIEVSVSLKAFSFLYSFNLASTDISIPVVVKKIH
jgi:hypothetical protein